VIWQFKDKNPIKICKRKMYSIKSSTASGPLLKSPRLKPYPLYQGENERENKKAPLDKEGFREI